MRVLTLTELMRLTRIELCALLTRITNELPDFPEGFSPIGASRLQPPFCATAGNNAYLPTSADEKRQMGEAA